MKKKIMHKAIKLFEKESFNKVSIDLICKECGVTKGAFYHYYKSKHMLVLEYFEEILIINQSTLLEIVIEKSSVKQIWQILEYLIESILKLGKKLTQEMLSAGLNSIEYLLPNGVEYKNNTLNYQLSMITKLIEKGQNMNEIDNRQNNFEIFRSFMYSFLGITYFWCLKKNEEINLKEETRKIFMLTFNAHEFF